MAKFTSLRTVIFVLLAASVLIFLGNIGLASEKAARVAGLENFGHARDRSYSANTSDTLEEREDVLFDGVRRFVRTYHHGRPELIFFVLTKDKSSWGYESRQPARTFHDFLGLINSTQFDLTRASLGIMTSSEEEYNLYRTATAFTPLARATVLFKKPGGSIAEQDKNLWTSVPRGGRHSHAIQTERRMSVAALRNELMTRALHDEQHIVWIDSDIRYISPGLLQTMLHHSETRKDAAIITARCQQGRNLDYDANSWAGGRSRSPSSGRAADAGVTKEELQQTQKHVNELIRGTNDSEIVRLDSVGGTILYIRASLVHQGLTFPPYYVIGTYWGREGWDGLETEGMCYVARYLRDGGCYVLGGRHIVQHTMN